MTPTPISGNATVATPPEHAFDVNTETELTLLDPSDESWAVIPSHALNNSTSQLEARPALASSFLLRRRGATDPDRLDVLGVNLIHSAVSTATEREDLLWDVLAQYAGLVVLAKTRRGSRHHSWPWHIATCIRGTDALGLAL